MARDASGSAEEQQRAALLRVGHRVVAPSSEAIDRRVRERERELELGDREAEHREVDRSPARDGRERLAEQTAVLGRAVEQREPLLPDRLVAESR